MKQQTAVEWLYNILCDKGYFKKLPVSEFKEALQMENEQIMEAHYAPKYGCFSEQYYNETYGDTTSHNK
jgi:hypothetical protein